MESSDPYRRPTADIDQTITTGGSQAISASQLGSFLVAFFGGGLIWGVSETITGYEEPWDAAWPYYYNSVFAVTLFAGTISKWSVWIPIVGVYAGQLFYCLFAYHPEGPIIIPALFAIGIFGTAPSIMGALLGLVPSVVWSLLSEIKAG